MGKINLIPIMDKKSPVVEAYRTLRTNIKLLSGDRKLRTILCTSANAGEGKTSIVANLAAAMGQDAQKVLIIDCNMRSPGQHKLFSINNIGLSDCLSSGDVADNYIHSTEIENVDVIPAGNVPANPSEMLGNGTMTTLLKTVGEKYDYVLLDMPPVLPVADAMVIAPSVDGIILVIGVGMVSPDEAKEVKKRLQQSGTPVLGVVMNKTESFYKYNY